jgi:chromosome segregation ATPase
MSGVTDPVSERPELDLTADPDKGGQVVAYPEGRREPGQRDEGAQRTELIRLRQELALMSDRLRVREDSLVKLNQRLRLLEADFAKEAQSLHASLHSEVAGGKEEIARLTNELARRDEDLAIAQRQLNALLATKTFRYTRAVRSLYSRLTPR